MLSLNRKSDEDHFSDLQDEFEACDDPERKKKIELEILELVDRNLRRELKPGLAAKLRLSQSPDASVRYTTLVNDFFIKVLGKAPENRPAEFWRARTLANLRQWASRCLTNQFITHYRRRKRGNEILRELAEQRRAHFEKNYGDLLFPEVLERLREWRASDDAEQQQLADIMLMHYVDGYSWNEIADQHGVTVKRLEYLRKKALEKLRNIFDR